MNPSFMPGGLESENARLRAELALVLHENRRQHAAIARVRELCPYSDTGMIPFADVLRALDGETR